MKIFATFAGLATLAGSAIIAYRRHVARARETAEMQEPTINHLESRAILCTELLASRARAGDFGARAALDRVLARAIDTAHTTPR